MRKLLMTVLLGLSMVIGQIFSVSQVEAKDVYVGTSNTTGRDCYLITETIGFFEGDANCTIKMVRRSDGNIKYLEYQFWKDKKDFTTIRFSTSQGFSGVVNKYSTPIEYNVYDYITTGRYN